MFSLPALVGVQRDADVTGTSAAGGGVGMVTQLLDLDRLMAVSTDYWLRPRLPDENVMFADVHWEVMKRIIPAYDRFVNLSTSINRSLSAEFDVRTASGNVAFKTSKYFQVEHR